jgi:DHA1 family inner membrane transport protein
LTLIPVSKLTVLNVPTLTSANASPTSSSRISILAFVITFVIGTDTFLVAPLLPTLSSTYGISTEMSGWLVSAYAIGYAIFALAAGPFSDLVNRRTVVIAGLGAFALCTAACGLAPTFWTMIVLRVLAGVAASLVVPQIWATIPAVVPAERVLKTMGHGVAGLSIAQVIGVPAGSAFAAISWRVPFFTLGAAALMVLAAVVGWFPSVPSAASGARRILSAYRGVLRMPRTRSYLIAYLVFGTGTYTMFTFIGTWYTRAFGLSVAQVGLAIVALGAGNAIGSMFGSHLVVRLGQPCSVLVGTIVLTALCVALPFAPGLAAAETILVLIFLAGGFVYPVLMTIMQSLTTTARGTVASLANAALYTAATVGGGLSGVLFTKFPGFYGVALFSAVAYGAALLLYIRGGLFRAPREAKKADTPKPEAPTVQTPPVVEHRG